MLIIKKIEGKKTSLLDANDNENRKDRKFNLRFHLYSCSRYFFLCARKIYIQSSTKKVCWSIVRIRRITQPIVEWKKCMQIDLLDSSMPACIKYIYPGFYSVPKRKEIPWFDSLCVWVFVIFLLFHFAVAGQLRTDCISIDFNKTKRLFGTRPSKTLFKQSLARNYSEVAFLSVFLCLSISSIR